MKNIHIGEDKKKFNCKYCGKGFNGNSIFEVHKKKLTVEASLV